MKVELKSEGKYEYFKSTDGKDILNLDNQAYYAIPGGKEGNTIESTDPDPDKESSISVGRYFFAEYQHDPEYRETSRIFLEDGPQYRELILPEGLPTKRNENQKKLVHGKNRYSIYQLQDHLSGKMK